MMCWKKISNWFLPDPPVEYSDKVALLFGINDYPGTSNDLNGCLNDITDVGNKLKSFGFQIRKFKDAEVTRARFMNELKDAIDAMPVDSTVVVFSDSCHSGSNTRNIRTRFVDPGLRGRWKLLHHVFRQTNMRWLAYAACKDDQYASDAWFNGRANGAFTFFAVRCMNPGLTYDELIALINEYLPSSNFSQHPMLEGPDYLRQRKIFEGPTLVVWYSGHGSYVKDYSGDEEDGLDETLYLYDGHLIDDEINFILTKIK